MKETKDESRSIVAVRIRAARESAGLSQGQVALKLDMHRPTISEIEAGRRKVTSFELVEFAKLYGVETWWLSGADPEDGHDVATVKYELAARELSKLKDEDFGRLMTILSTMRKAGGNADD